MTVSVSILNRDKLQRSFHITAEVTFDASYVTGGEPITASMFQLDKIISVKPMRTDEFGVACWWDRANSKLRLGDEDNTSGIEAQFASTGDASGVVVLCEVIGR
jgi:hypothetical protein